MPLTIRDFGVICLNEKAERLLPIVKGWIYTNKKYAAVHAQEKDVGYYYNERANVSLLAAGAWHAKFVALEEYVAAKKREKKISSGRGDLYISNDEWNVNIEAKQKWPWAGQKDNYLNREIKDGIGKAVSDAHCLEDSMAQFGGVFFGPGFYRDDFPKYSGNYDEIISTELQRYISYSDVDIWAWCFPPACRKIFATQHRAYYPGILLALKGANYW